MGMPVAFFQAVEHAVVEKLAGRGAMAQAGQVVFREVFSR
jgi:hypothetical protein